MKRFLQVGLITIGLVLALVGGAVAREKYSLDPLWLDFDMENIKEPSEHKTSYYYNFFGSQFIEQWKQALDVPRWTRAAVSKNKRAANSNELDEVPDSSWYTNRHALRRMTIEELVRGPDRSDGPDFGEGTVVIRAKTAGVTPGMWLKDKRGVSYIVKFDSTRYPELQSGAEVIATKILHAAGYNVPENYIASVRPETLKISEKVTIKTGATSRPFQRSDLDSMMERVPPMPDGSYRVLASRILAGKPKGPFSQVGIRRDDPNDLIPHEHRRELRGLRVIASWINHWDMKEDNSLDMYVEEDGRKFLRHYLIDFGSALGGGKTPLEYFHGREYAMDAANIMKEIFTLGIYTTPDEKEVELISPAMAIFSNREFDAEGWSPSFPVLSFENMTDEDAFWGTRILLSFSEPELRAIIKTARYTNPSDNEYLLKTLMDRRATIGRHWLSKVNPIAQFSVDAGPGGPELRFKDLVIEHGWAAADSAEYIYEVESIHRKAASGKSTRATRIPLDQPVISASASNGNSGGKEEGIVRVKIETVRAGADRDPVTVYLYPDGAGQRYRVVGIKR